jgi:hypothetical protein
VIALLLLPANNIILRRNNQTRVHAARKKATRRDLVPINMRKEEFSAEHVLLKIFSALSGLYVCVCVVSERWMLAGCIVLCLSQQSAPGEN